MNASRIQRLDSFDEASLRARSNPIRVTEMGTPDASDSKDVLEEELERLHSRSFGWALSCCGFDREEADDVLQVVYLKVLDGRAKFGQRSLFSTWLFGVIRRTASERRRKRTTRSLLLLRHAKELASTTEPTSEPMSVDVRKLREALLTLPRRQQEILHLVFYDDHSIRDAAEIMEVGLGSARVHYDRAKKKLRAKLENE